MHTQLVAGSDSQGNDDMAKEDNDQQDGEELEELLKLDRSRSASPNVDITAHPASQSRPSLNVPRRQSSLAQSRSSGTPRTQNRVRFDIEDSVHSVGSVHEDEEAVADDWVEEEDYMSSNGHANRYGGRSGQRAPLLTGIEAPTVTVAESDFNPEELLESSRPKSGMKSAFMNMANSIMYVEFASLECFYD